MKGKGNKDSNENTGEELHSEVFGELPHLEDLGDQEMELAVGGAGQIGPVQLKIGQGVDTLTTKQLLPTGPHGTGPVETKQQFMDDLHSDLVAGLEAGLDEKVGSQATILEEMSNEASHLGIHFNMQKAEAALHNVDAAQYAAGLNIINQDCKELSEQLEPGMRLTRDGEARLINDVMNQIEGGAGGAHGLGEQEDQVLNHLSHHGLLTNGEVFHDGPGGQTIPSITNGLEQMGEALQQSSLTHAQQSEIAAFRLSEKLLSDPKYAVEMDIPTGADGQWTSAEWSVLESDPTLAAQDHVKIVVENEGGILGDIGQWIENHQVVTDVAIGVAGLVTAGAAIGVSAAADLATLTAAGMIGEDAAATGAISISSAAAAGVTGSMAGTAIDAAVDLTLGTAGRALVGTAATVGAEAANNAVAEKILEGATTTSVPEKESTP